MKRKNYRWRFATSFCLAVLLPIFAIIDLVGSILVALSGGDVWGDILLIQITLLVMWVLAYFTFVLLGNLLFKKHHFAQDEQFFYQNKRKLKRENLLRVELVCIMKIYCVTFYPIKNGVFKSYILKYYFYSFEEMANFVLKNKIKPLLTLDEQEYFNELIMQVESAEEEFNFERFPCPCCGNYTFYEMPRGTNFICPVCFWEDDKEQFDNPDLIKEINRVSLNQARLNYQTYGVCIEDLKEFSRAPKQRELPPIIN